MALLLPSPIMAATGAAAATHGSGSLPPLVLAQPTEALQARSGDTRSAAADLADAVGLHSPPSDDPVPSEAGGPDGDSDGGSGDGSDEDSSATGSDSEAPYTFVSPHNPNPALATTAYFADRSSWAMTKRGVGPGGGAGGSGREDGDGVPTTALRAMRSSDLRHMLVQYQASVLRAAAERTPQAAAAGGADALDESFGYWYGGEVEDDAGAAAAPAPVAASAGGPPPPPLLPGFQWPSFRFLASPAVLARSSSWRARESGTPWEDGSGRRDSDASASGLLPADSPDARERSPDGGAGAAGFAPAAGGAAVGVPQSAYLLDSSVGAKHTAIADDYDLGPGAGQGGYAAVRTASTRHTAVPLACVVKCIRKRYLLTPEERDSVTREVEIHRSLRHPNIVELWDAYEDEREYVYLVMERVSGGDLASYIRRKAVRQFSEVQVRTIMEQILAAVDYMHSRGVLHADLKPDNILLAESPLDAPVGGLAALPSAADLAAATGRSPLGDGAGAAAAAAAGTPASTLHRAATMLPSELLFAAGPGATGNMGGTSGTVVMVASPPLPTVATPAGGSDGASGGGATSALLTSVVGSGALFVAGASPSTRPPLPPVVATAPAGAVSTAGARRGAGTSTTGAALTTFIDWVKVCDFGAARRSRDARYYSVTGDVGLVPWTSIAGTMGYIAPEILRRRHYNAVCDLWSCGVIMYELLSGYPPWQPYSLCTTVPVAFPPPAWDGVSSEAKALCRAMLCADPSKRITAAAARAHAWFQTVSASA